MRHKILFLTLLLFIACLAGTSCGRHEAALADGTNFEKKASIDPAIREAELLIEKAPDQAVGYTQLAVVYMKRARETGDFQLNVKAVEALERALEKTPEDVPARKLQASLHLAYHRFAEAIEAATKLQSDYPTDSFVYGILSDAYVEIGDYKKAVQAGQKMVDLKPGTPSYSRVAQLRSLHGDHMGAVEMFKQAARSADPNDKEGQSWCLVQLGDEYWKYGNYADAEKVYDEALANYPDYFLALVSKGRVRASVGDLLGAEQLLVAAQARVPNANATLLLGDIYILRGESERGKSQYEQFDAIQEKLGVAADHKRLVLSWADRGEIDKAFEMAESEYAAEKSIHSADLLAWSLFKKGNAAEAKKYIAEAMRLNTNDARVIFHAGMIAKANGEGREAKRLLNKALKLNPAFDLVQAEEARRALTEL